MTAFSEAHAPGAPSATGGIPLAVPNIGPAERAAVLEAVESGFVSSVGPAVEAFEREFAEVVGSTYAVACASGTAALHVALRLLGVGAGDEVLCSDFTFIGSSNPIAYLGARATLVDSETRTWNMDPQLVADEFARRRRMGAPMPKAVELVHVLGQPADAASILEICADHDAPVIEDAAESLGATWSSGTLTGRSTGAVGRIGCFSFNGNKIATSGGGGMIVTDDEALARRAKHLTTQAKVPDVGYLHDDVGYNYRLTNLSAALGLAQVRRLDEFVASKRSTAAAYDAAFADLALTRPPRIEGFDSTYWLYSVLVPEGRDRDVFLQHLTAAGVGARALWRPLHAQPPLRDADRLGGQVADALFDRGVSLPCSSTITPAEIERVTDAVQSFFTVS